MHRAPPSEGLRYVWAAQALAPSASVYALGLLALWLVSSSACELRIGYWFAWQVWMYSIVATPYVSAYRGTFEAAEEACGRTAVVEQAASWIHFRAFAQFVLLLAAAVEDAVFAGLTWSTIVSDCGARTACDANVAAYVASALLATGMTVVASALAYMVARLPTVSSAAVLPAPPLLHRAVRL